ncbi:hypothetical protein IB277_20870 [Ensifer sp. ENS07]|uniref:hypothetical protein n=1 Tax=unclassified Ensifer TaxID=2633371 RepID=UPI00178189CD|nr:hypothetical protein [Ensifer sp. ENS07]MBD9638752.1 hypothetical protein [Ensifer sp. ENS07]
MRLTLGKVHQELCEILGWLSVNALTWSNQYCRFQATYPAVPIIVGNLKNPILVM